DEWAHDSSSHRNSNTADWSILRSYTNTGEWDLLDFFPNIRRVIQDEQALCQKFHLSSVIASTRDRWPRNALANFERKIYETRGNRGITQFERQRFPR